MLTSLAPGITVIASQRRQLIQALNALNNLSTVTVPDVEGQQEQHRRRSAVARAHPEPAGVRRFGAAAARCRNCSPSRSPTGATSGIEGDYLNTYATLVLRTPGGKVYPSVPLTRDDVTHARTRGATVQTPTTAPSGLLPATSSVAAGLPSTVTRHSRCDHGVQPGGWALMLNVKTRVQVIAFVVIALLGVAYVGVRYVGITRWFGAGYTVKLDLAAGGGIFPNADVTYRGVSVGRVGDMRLTQHGIQVQLDMTSSRSIPSDVRAVVADGSVIGEQYVDLRPRTATGPYLHDGSVIARQDTALPIPVRRLLQTTVRFRRIGAGRRAADGGEPALPRHRQLVEQPPYADHVVQIVLHRSEQRVAADPRSDQDLEDRARHSAGDEPGDPRFQPEPEPHRYPAAILERPT